MAASFTNGSHTQYILVGWRCSPRWNSAPGDVHKDEQARIAKARKITTEFTENSKMLKRFHLSFLDFSFQFCRDSTTELCPGGNTRKQTEHASRRRWHTSGTLSSRPGWFMVYGASTRTVRAVTQRNPVPKNIIRVWGGGGGESSIHWALAMCHVGITMI